MKCGVLSDVTQLKSRQKDVRPLHPEDMMHDEILVRLFDSGINTKKSFYRL